MKVYKENLIAVLTQLGIAIPDYITMDQKQVTRMVAAIETALDTYDPAPPGDALVTDVLVGKIFSTAAGLGLVGTLELTALPEPSFDVMGDLKLIVNGAVMLASLFDVIEIYDANSDTKLGEVVYDEMTGYIYDLSGFLTAGGSYLVGAKYIAGDGVTLKDSATAEVAVTVYDITRTLTGCEDSSTQAVALENGQISGTLSLLAGFTTLPAAITITSNAVELIAGDDYTYNDVTGTYNVNNGVIDGDVVITAVATA